MKMITLVGNAVRDAEIRTTQNGDVVCSFSLAVNDKRANETYFFDCNYWGKAGEAVALYIEKGKQLTVVGDLSWREYNGNKYLQCRVSSLTLGQRAKSDGANLLPSKQKAALDAQPDYNDEIPF